MDKNFKIAWFGTHPIQYHSPMFSQISQDPNIDLTVYYFSDFSIRGYEDTGFGETVKWDIPLLHGYKYKILKNYTSKKHGSFFSYLNFGIFNAIKKENYDFIVIHGWNTFSHLLIIFSCLLTSTPYALRGDTNSFGEKSRKGLKQLVRKLFLKTIFHKADAIFYIGEQNKKFYRYFNVPENKLYKMPFAVDNNYFREYGEKLNIKQEKKTLGIKDNEKVILYTGKLIALKKPDILIQALRNISNEYILLVVGDGEERKTLEKLAQHLQVNVKFLGFVNQSEIPKYYWISDIFVLPSDKEAWGLSINEAMNCNCAIVVSDRVGAKDDLIHNNGFIFKAGSVDDLASKLKILLGDDTLLDDYKKNSYEIIDNYAYKNDLKALREYFNL